MTWLDGVKLALPVILPVILAFLGFWFAIKQEASARRDQFVTETLVDAYMALERFLNRQYDKNAFYKEHEDIWCLELEDALASLQLLAPKDVAEKVAESIREGQFEPDPNLLVLFRSKLRDELGLKPVSIDPRSLRFVKKTKKAD